MFAVNQERISRSAYKQLFDRYAQLEVFRHGIGETRCYALCSADPLFALTMILFLRESGLSVLPLHGDTPIETASRLAERAGCTGLFYGAAEQYYPSDAPAVRTNEPPSIYQFSSGTTGEPKLIRRSWEEINVEIAAYNERLAAHAFAEDTPVVLASVTHAYGLISGVLSALERGVEPIVMSGKGPKAIAQCLKVNPKHLLYGVPALLQGLGPLFEHGGVKLRSVMSSGAPLSPILYEQYNKASALLLQQYGCTEAGCASLVVGMKSYDDLGTPLGHLTIQAAAEPSELIISVGGKTIPTGDLGCSFGGGNIRFLGRIDDLINVSGLKVTPAEVEEVICRLEGVIEAVVYRGIHPINGETVRAQVVAADAVTAGDVREWCLRYLPPYKAPSEVRMTASIQKMPSGKISRKLLEQEGV
ncbi:acyl-CoA synthetase [Paenibacillus sp. 1011MAR3C5]|uniref:AMP-binding protein n=1 Tax=Paenibacillus sp. 1011MAR3C5 TaxID=1675787 RepID=UPI000E6B998C|nr:AMP-binding protein [Paenibacillus sp. 1011MAR3C5]RJE87516.1 acyl-CoA synthetase [Paenibacillus sp. 1011MAR3C5]